jgi:hypothetical protein
MLPVSFRFVGRGKTRMRAVDKVVGIRRDKGRAEGCGLSHITLLTFSAL